MRLVAAAIPLILFSGSLCAQGFPQPRVPAGNPITANKALLGKSLFWDEQLSSSRTVSCGTCHMPENGGSDPRNLSGIGQHPGFDGRFSTADDVLGSAGVVGRTATDKLRAAAHFGLGEQVTRRRAMTVINAAYDARLFWDGRATGRFVDPSNGTTVLLPQDAALESQAAEPIVNDVEMAHLGRRWPEVVQRLKESKPLALATNVPAALASFIANKSYADLFLAAFGTSDITPARIAMAIATYERTLISNQSRFDDFRQRRGTLTAAESRGMNVFNQLRCQNCHREPLFTDGSFRNTGVRPVAEDAGRFEVTRNQADRGRFKVPTLRNVALRAPYFHNGRFATLDDVISFYARGGDSRDNLDRAIRPFRISANQRADLIAFLNALTDPRVVARSAPFDRPTLYSESARVPASFGVASRGTGGVAPRMVALDPPLLGNPGMAIGLENAVPGGIALLGLDGVANTTGIPVRSIRLHLALSSSFMWIGGVALPRTGDEAGTGSLVVSLPNTPALRGATAHVQWIVADSGAPEGLAATDARTIRIF